MNNKNLILELKKLLASNFVLYLRTHGFHWNVEGNNFEQLHSMFERQYIDLWEQVDIIAEKIRFLDDYAPSTLERYMELNEIDTDAKIPSASNMILCLLKDHEKMIEILTRVFNTAETVNDQAIMNYIAERLDMHKKHRWQLLATSKTNRN